MLCWGDVPNALAATPGSEPALSPTVSGVTGLWPGFLDMLVRTDGGFVLHPLSQRLPFADGATVANPLHGAVCATSAAGRVSCFGDNRFGLLGGADDAPTRRTADLALQDVRALAVGATHACALQRDGTVWCWGDASGGALGNPSASLERCAGHQGEGVPCARSPVRVAGIDDAVAVSASQHFSCAIRRDEGVWCWGRYRDGLSWSVPVRMDW